MDRITFDFENGEIIINNSGQDSVLADPEIKNKKSAILSAAGLEEISGEELRNDINELFEQLGIDAACAGPKQ